MRFVEHVIAYRLLCPCQSRLAYHDDLDVGYGRPSAHTHDCLIRSSLKSSPSILLFLTGPVQRAPIATLGTMLVVVSLSLFDTRTLREIWKVDRAEVGLALAITLGVVAAGAINGIPIAVGLALIRFVKVTARLKDEVLGAVDGFPGQHSIERHPGAKTFPRLVLNRFDGPRANPTPFSTAKADFAELGPNVNQFLPGAMLVAVAPTC